jgi:hypothetical protein
MILVIVRRFVIGLLVEDLVRTIATRRNASESRVRVKCNHPHVTQFSPSGVKIPQRISKVGLK